MARILLCMTIAAAALSFGSMAQAGLDEDFKAAVAYIDSLEGNKKAAEVVTSDEMLELYKWFKQATKGDAT